VGLLKILGIVQCRLRRTVSTAIRDRSISRGL
jgi:hypothetical protein